MNRRKSLQLAGIAAFSAAIGSISMFGRPRAAPVSTHAKEIDRMSDQTPMRAINPAGSTIPNISQAMLIESNKLLFLSGHVPLNDDGVVAGSSLEVQLDQTFLNLGKTLAAADADFSNVARMTIYVRDLKPDELPVIRAVRDRHINRDRPPASALIGVAELFSPDIRVEVDAIAAL
ncbi:RidA family protein [Aquamicrobium sp. NLF2-7]|uniref:RidA family protein n=1 Tax=Aquamicrobium sp. NLF2-7 TaxID=2918753 RepID=UPI001EFB35F0|nr:RidA family protein [Aquamicrobium sp. NLF2-7]MCG8273907.1 RidA family protein [Aquamicrobium sp. NLF2-7]